MASPTCKPPDELLQVNREIFDIQYTLNFPQCVYKCNTQTVRKNRFSHENPWKWYDRIF